VTGGGNPDWKTTHEPAEKTARAVGVLAEAGAEMIGKTITDELTRGIFGENAHYGTPVNPRAPGRVPGGSSSGSASAVAGGMVDFALGSDTGGSVRVPSSFCGLYGLRPTHGRIPLEGILIQAPSFDTIGWFAREAATFARVGEVLLQSEIQEARPSRIVVAEDAFELAERAVAGALEPFVDKISALVGNSAAGRISETSLDELRAHQWRLQNREGWESARGWLDRVNPRLKFDVAERYAAASAITDAEIEAASSVQADFVERMEPMLAGGAVVCMPTTAAPAPPVGESLSARATLRSLNSSLTCIAGMLGAPQINLPLAEVDGLPAGLSLLGERGSDEMLIAFAREIEASLKS
jgi:amidase